jgi:hypothetical protein
MQLWWFIFGSVSYICSYTLVCSVSSALASFQPIARLPDPRQRRLQAVSGATYPLRPLSILLNYNFFLNQVFLLNYVYRRCVERLCFSDVCRCLCSTAYRRPCSGPLLLLMGSRLDTGGGFPLAWRVHAKPFLLLLRLCSLMSTYVQTATVPARVYPSSKFKIKRFILLPLLLVLLCHAGT